MGCGSSSIFYALKWSRNKWRNAFWECGFLIKILLLSFLAGKQQLLIFAYLWPCMVVPGSGINFLHYSRRLDQGGSFWALQVENISELWSHEHETFSYFYLRVYNAGALNSSILPWADCPFFRRNWYAWGNPCVWKRPWQNFSGYRLCVEKSLSSHWGQGTSGYP